MKPILIILSLLITASCFGQAKSQAARRHNLLGKGTAAAGGGGGSGVVGPPVVYMVRTNGTSGSTLSAGTAVTNIVETSTDANRLIVYLIDWWPNTSLLTNVSFNGVTNGVLQLHSNLWFAGGQGVYAVFYLTNPPVGSTYYTTAVKFNATVDEVNFYTVCLTNAAQTSTFNTLIHTNLGFPDTGATNSVVSATNELVIGYSANAAGGQTVTWISGWTKRGERSTGASEHTSGFATQLGIAGSNTNSVIWGEAGDKMLFGVSIRGINAP